MRKILCGLGFSSAMMDGPVNVLPGNLGKVVFRSLQVCVSRRYDSLDLFLLFKFVVCLWVKVVK